MQYHLDKADLPVACTYCDWEGKLCQTDDMDVMDAQWTVTGSTCVCPRCAREVHEIGQQKSAF